MSINVWFTYLTNQFSKITAGGICRETENLGKKSIRQVGVYAPDNS
jgi:hypothetical protein